VIFARADPGDARVGLRADVAAHEVYVEDGGHGADTCAARVFHRGFQDESGDQRVELALVVATGGDPAQRCTLASTFATPVAERLPKP
jgi:hypothetical protein